MPDRLPPADDGCNEPEAWAWCSGCEAYYPSDCFDCPACWGPDDVVGLGPEPDWETGAGVPDWYRALAPHHDWRD